MHWARRYQDLVEQFESSPLEDAVILNYHKLLAIKDEYEVARLHLQTEKLVRREFEGQFRMSFSPGSPHSDNVFGKWTTREA